MLADDDVVAIGKLRRPGRPGAAVSYDPGYGIRVEGEDAPPEPRAAVLWMRAAGGWLRVYGAAKKSDRVVVQDFLALWRGKR